MFNKKFSLLFSLRKPRNYVRGKQPVYQRLTIDGVRNGSYLGSFDIKIKGKSQLMQIPFEVLENGQNKSLKANFNLSISAFDIGGGIVSYLVGDKVTVNLDLLF